MRWMNKLVGSRRNIFEIQYNGEGKQDMQRVRQIVLALTAIISCVLQPLLLHGAEQPIEFKTVSLDDLFGGPPAGMNVKRYFPIDVDIPALYKGHPNPSWAGELFWSSDSDVERVTEEGKPPQEHGFFSIKVSMNFGYDARKDVFSDFQGSDEKNMKAKLSKQGFKDALVKRYNTRGFPILIIEADGPQGRKMRTAYVATKVDTNVLFIYYVHRNPWSKWDDEVWTRFKSTLLRSYEHRNPWSKWDDEVSTRLGTEGVRNSTASSIPVAGDEGLGKEGWEKNEKKISK